MRQNPASGFAYGAAFRIAEQYGVMLDDGPIEDETFLRFQDQYLTWSRARDAAVMERLRTSPNLFRVYLHFTERVVGLVPQIVWYVDEMILADPIALALESPSGNLEARKQRCRDILEVVSRFREPIDDGLLLFLGSTVFPSPPPEATAMATSLVGDSDLVSALRAALRFGSIMRPDSAGNPTVLYQVTLDSGCLLGWQMQPVRTGTVTSPAITIGEKFPVIGRDRLVEILGRDPLVGHDEDQFFAREISRTLVLAHRAEQFGAAILFDREVDSLILRKAPAHVCPTRQTATVEVLNFALPYVNGIPPERMMSLRHNMPHAFKEFRGKMLDIVNEASAARTGLPDEFHARVDRETARLVQSLDAELGSALTKAGILRLGLPLIGGIAALLGWIIGTPTTAPLASLAAGAIGGLKAHADMSAAEKRSASHPFYFLWKARRLA
jgi:hypothetical protein